MSDETRLDRVTPALAARFAATLDRAPCGDEAPQGIHWCLCTPEAGTTDLGADGHPAVRGGDLLSRRMWAASDILFHAPIAIGVPVERRSQVTAVVEKMGSSGPLRFVTVRHEIDAGGVRAIEETQTIVYRAPAASTPLAGTGGIGTVTADLPPADPRWHRQLVPDPRLLFRYSALTFNSHRIHYDLPYARDVEGYAGLVVHGPLTATLLLDLCDRALGANRIARFAFRAVAPAIAGETLALVGRPEGDGIALTALADGRTVMTAEATPRR